MADARQKHLVEASKKIFKNEEILTSSALEILTAKADAETEYQVIAHFLNELKMGWYRNGNIVFAKGSGVEDKYLQQLRAFNDDSEILLKKVDGAYWVRTIKDEDGEGIEVVDSTSTIFGKRIEMTDLLPDFAVVYEPGRKIKLELPVKEISEKYCVTTRSYITYDTETGQAGYGYYRYVGIKAEGR